MLYDTNKRINLALLTSAICAFLSTSAIAMDDSDDDSGCCGCFGGSNKKERQGLLREEERSGTTRPPFQVVVQREGTQTSARSAGGLPYQQMPPQVGTNAHEGAPVTPLRRDSESGSELPVSPSVNLDESNTSKPAMSSLQRQIWKAAEEKKISQRIWDLLSEEKSIFQPLCDEINKAEYAEATSFEISFSNARMCKLKVMINGEPIIIRVEFTK